MRRLARALLVVAAAGGCHRRTPPPAADAGSGRRVLGPALGHVLAVPPFAIRSDGVGPYLLGAQLLDVLGLMPSGPHVELLQLEGVAAYSVARAEEGMLVIGVEPQVGVTFAAVLDKEIARTATGVGVGSTEEELRAALGPPLARDDVLADPRIHEFASLPHVRFLVEGGRVAAVVVGRPSDAGEEEAPAPPAARDPACRTGGAWAEARAALVEAAKLEEVAPDRVSVSFGCFSGAAPEALVVGGGKLALVGGDPAKPRRLALYAGTAGYAGPLDLDGDGRDEIAVVSEVVSDEERAVQLEVLRWDAGKLAVAVAAEPVYRVSSMAASWIGASLSRIDFLLEVSVRGGALRTGGLYVHRREGGGVRDAAPMMQRAVEIKRRRPGGAAPEGTGPAGSSDAGSPGAPAAGHVDGGPAPGAAPAGEPR